VIDGEIDLKDEAANAGGSNLHLPQEQVVFRPMRKKMRKFELTSVDTTTVHELNKPSSFQHA